MHPFTDILNQFFELLKMDQDIHYGHHYKSFIRSTINIFLREESKKTALSVYDAFFSAYRITPKKGNNPPCDLMDVVRDYETHTVMATSHQRNNYIHSVNVFLLGLCIYIKNCRFQNAFQSACLGKKNYPNSFDTYHEAFFYRWGIASLFHDIAYSFEVNEKQLQKFLDLYCRNGDCSETKARVVILNINEINKIPEIISKDLFTKHFVHQNPASSSLDLLKPADLLAYKLHQSLHLDLETMRSSLNKSLQIMSDYGSIEHGLLAASIVLKWYGYLIQSCQYEPDIFFDPILNSASAILLHSYYKKVLIKPPFNKEPLSPNAHPIAFLLILSDLLQAWAPDDHNCEHVFAKKISFFINNQSMEITYIFNNRRISDQFAIDLIEKCTELLDTDALFPDSFLINIKANDNTTLLSDLSKTGER